MLCPLFCHDSPPPHYTQYDSNALHLSCWHAFLSAFFATIFTLHVVALPPDIIHVLVTCICSQLSHNFLSAAPIVKSRLLMSLFVTLSCTVLRLWIFIVFILQCCLEYKRKVLISRIQMQTAHFVHTQIHKHLYVFSQYVETWAATLSQSWNQIVSWVSPQFNACVYWWLPICTIEHFWICLVASNTHVSVWEVLWVYCPWSFPDFLPHSLSSKYFYRSLSGNYLSFIPADIFTPLTDLRTL